MKRVAVFLLISLGWLNLHGQELDKTFYLLGTLSDYMGRQYPKNNPIKTGFVLTLHKDRMGEIKRIEEVTGKKFKKQKAKKDCRNCQDFYSLKSTPKAHDINSFYTFEKKNLNDKMGFSFYTGT